ncbi:MAG: TonB-dependent receptor [Pseudomonadota bacterium]
MRPSAPTTPPTPPIKIWRWTTTPSTPSSTGACRARASSPCRGGLNDGLDEFFALGTTGDYYSDQHATYLRGDAGVGPVRLRTFWNHLDTRSGPWYYQTGTASWGADVLMDIFDVDLAGDWSLGKQKRHRITASGGYRFKDIDWNYLDAPHTEHHFNAFLQDESRLGPVVATGSIRVDEHPLVGVMPSPRLAVVTNLGEGRALRLNGGTAFRTPTFMESYTSMQQRLSTDAIIITSVGDLDLAPERMLAFEAGYLEHSSDWWRGELSGYYYRVSDLIELGPVTVTPDHLQFDDEAGGWRLGETPFMNLPPVYHAFGGEVAVDLFRFEGLDINASYAFEMIQAVEDGETTRSESTPMHKVNGGVIYRSPWRVDASMNAAWVDKQVWGIRSFDATGQIQVDEDPLPGWVILSNRVVVHGMKDHRLDLTLDAWNWLALIPSVGSHREYPMGQPVGARLTAGLSTRF